MGRCVLAQADRDACSGVLAIDVAQEGRYGRRGCEGAMSGWMAPRGATVRSRHTYIAGVDEGQRRSQNLGARGMCFILLGAFVFGPRLKVVDLHAVAVLGFGGLGVVMLFRGGKVTRRLGGILLLHLPVIMYVLLVSELAGGNDFTILSLLLRSPLYMVGSYAVWRMYESVYRGDAGSAVLAALSVWTGINAAIVIASALSREVRRVLFDHITYGLNEVWVELGHRGADVVVGAGAGAASVFASLVVVAGVGRRAWSSFWPPMLVVAAGLAATVLLGRTGLLLLVVYGVGLLGWQAFAGLRSGDEGRPTRGGWSFVVGVGAVIGVASVVLLGGTGVGNHVRDNLAPRAFEFAYGDVRQGSTGVRSLDAIVGRMYFWPEESFEMLFGTGNAGRNAELPYIASDVGLVRMVFAVGIMGALLTYGLCLYLMWSCWIYGEKGPLRHGAIVIAAFWLLTNFKELHLFPRAGAAVFYVLLIGCLAGQSGNRSGRPSVRRDVVG